MRTRLIVSLLCAAVLISITFIIASRLSDTEPVIAKELNIDPEQVTPTIDVNSPAEFYIPPDLEGAVFELRRMLPPDLLRRLALSVPRDAFMLDYNSRRWLISHWNLDNTSPLSDYFRSEGIRHPEDMTAVVFDALIRDVSGRPWTISQELDCGRFFTDQREDPDPRQLYSFRCTF